jgi:hypothetical protein
MEAMPYHCILSRRAEKIRIRKMSVVSIRVLCLDNYRASPRFCRAWMKLRGAHEFRVPAAVGTIRKSLDRYA